MIKNSILKDLYASLSKTAKAQNQSQDRSRDQMQNQGQDQNQDQGRSRDQMQNQGQDQVQNQGRDQLDAILADLKEIVDTNERLSQGSYILSRLECAQLREKYQEFVNKCNKYFEAEAAAAQGPAQNGSMAFPGIYELKAVMTPVNSYIRLLADLESGIGKNMTMYQVLCNDNIFDGMFVDDKKAEDRKDYVKGSFKADFRGKSPTDALDSYMETSRPVPDMLKQHIANVTGYPDEKNPMALLQAKLTLMHNVLSENALEKQEEGPEDEMVEKGDRNLLSILKGWEKAAKVLQPGNVSVPGGLINRNNFDKKLGDEVGITYVIGNMENALDLDDSTKKMLEKEIGKLDFSPKRIGITDEMMDKLEAYQNSFFAFLKNARIALNTRDFHRSKRIRYKKEVIEPERNRRKARLQKELSGLAYGDLYEYEEESPERDERIEVINAELDQIAEEAALEEKKEKKIKSNEKRLIDGLNNLCDKAAAYMRREPGAGPVTNDDLKNYADLLYQYIRDTPLQDEVNLTPGVDTMGYNLLSGFFTTMQNFGGELDIVQDKLKKCYLEKAGGLYKKAISDLCLANNAEDDDEFDKIIKNTYSIVKDMRDKLIIPQSKVDDYKLVRLFAVGNARSEVDNAKNIFAELRENLEKGEEIEEIIETGSFGINDNYRDKVLGAAKTLFYNKIVSDFDKRGEYFLNEKEPFKIRAKAAVPEFINDRGEKGTLTENKADEIIAFFGQYEKMPGMQKLMNASYKEILDVFGDEKKLQELEGELYSHFYRPLDSLKLQDDEIEVLTQSSGNFFSSNSDEYDAIAKSLLELNKNQQPIKPAKMNCKAFWGVYKACDNYLTSHDSRPASPNGKRRFNTTADIVRRLTIPMLSSLEKNDHAPSAAQVENSMSINMLRSKKFRDSIAAEAKEEIERLNYMLNGKMNEKIYKNLTPPDQKKLKYCSRILHYAALLDVHLEGTEYKMITGKMNNPVKEQEINSKAKSLYNLACRQLDELKAEDILKTDLNEKALSASMRKVQEKIKASENKKKTIQPSAPARN